MALSMPHAEHAEAAASSCQAATSCSDCLEFGCTWQGVAGCTADCALMDISCFMHRCPTDMPAVCIKFATCSECTDYGCIWQESTCGAECRFGPDGELLGACNICAEAASPPSAQLLAPGASTLRLADPATSALRSHPPASSPPAHPTLPSPTLLPQPQPPPAVSRPLQPPPGNASGHHRYPDYQMSENEVLALGLVLLVIMPAIFCSKSTSAACKSLGACLAKCFGCGRSPRIGTGSRHQVGESSGVWHETTLNSPLAKSDGARIDRAAEDAEAAEEDGPPSYKEIS